MGNKPTYHKLDDNAFLSELKKKLIEETSEIEKADGEELRKELADIQEIIDNILVALKINPEKIKEIQTKKNEKVGSFKEKLFVEYVDALDDSPWVEYYLSEPERYPEIKE